MRRSGTAVLGSWQCTVVLDDAAVGAGDVVLTIEASASGDAIVPDLSAALRASSVALSLVDGGSVPAAEVSWVTEWGRAFWRAAEAAWLFRAVELGRVAGASLLVDSHRAEVEFGPVDTMPA